MTAASRAAPRALAPALLTEDPIDAAALWSGFLAEIPAEAGGVAGFVGVCRAHGADGSPLRAMTLECYPAMGARILEALRLEAIERWRLSAAWVIHRYGRVVPGDALVAALAASAGREAAFSGARFLIDMTKTKAPLWKREETALGSAWVETREQDLRAAAAWNDSD